MKVEVGENRGLLYRERDYEEIKSDLLGIVKQVKAIDPDYFFLRRKRDGKIELHHKGQPDFSFCLMIPFDTLDDRTLKHVWDTRIEKTEALLAEMEAHNNKIDKDADDYMRDYVKWVSKETYSYVNKHYSKEVLDDGAFKTRFV
jgi:hypothetical protein